MQRYASAGSPMAIKMKDYHILTLAHHKFFLLRKISFKTTYLGSAILSPPVEILKQVVVGCQWLWLLGKG